MIRGAGGGVCFFPFRSEKILLPLLKKLYQISISLPIFLLLLYNCDPVKGTLSKFWGERSHVKSNICVKEHCSNAFNFSFHTVWVWILAWNNFVRIAKRNPAVSMLSAIALLHTWIQMDKCHLHVRILINPSCIFQATMPSCSFLVCKPSQTIPLRFLAFIQCH